SWYSHNDPTFAWKLGPSIDAVNILADKNATSNPGTNSDGLLKTYQYDDVADGEWFFHIRLRNSEGWGGITHFGFKVDTTKPESLTLKLLPRTDPSDPRLAVEVLASDRLSGIDYYEFSLDNETPITWRDDGTQQYRLVAASGEHTLLVKVYDKAGNYLAESLKFDVDTLDPPRLTDYPKEVVVGEALAVGGETYPEVTVNLTLESEGGEKITFSTRSNRLGKFIATADRKLKEGIYNLSAYVTDDRGAQSAASSAIAIPVVLPHFLKFGLNTINALAVFVPILAMLLLIIFLVIYSWHKVSGLRRRVKKQSREAEEAVRRAFDLLHGEVVDGVMRLETARDKRELTREEKSMLRQFRKILTDAEKYLEKEIMDIEKEVE
ncbi:MAG: hypothetical protein AAB589_02085, partial [Patescibacteria group bacterium]